MDVFDKCRQFDAMLQLVRSRGQFFFSRDILPAAAPVATRGGRELINLGSNNYLGLTQHPEVKAAAVAAVEKHGTGSAGSRLLTGTTPLHLEMERELAGFKHVEAVVTYSAGFMALAGTVGTLAGEGEFLLSDELNHASIINGCRQSRAKTLVYRHSDPADLEEKIRALPLEAGKLIVTDGVFSMEGDICNLPELRRIADTYRARLMVDDAHATGVLGRTGRGTAEHFDVEGKVDIVSGTFSKSLGAVGGFSGSTRFVADYLRYNARESIFSASLPPPVVATVIAALKVLREQPGLVARLRTNTGFLHDRLATAGFKVRWHGTPILPILIGDDTIACRVAGRLEEQGVFANPVVFPAVPRGAAIIRVSLMASHTEEQLAEAAESLVLVGRELGVI
jgi:8-amino-7-oxononanoate synthase